MRRVVRFALLGIILFGILFGEYQIFIKGPEYAKPQSGEVVYSYESKGRYSSEWLATVKFDNGDTQQVNTGGYAYKIGDRFTGSLSWNPILGACGFAYSWSPPNWVRLTTAPAIVFNTILLIAVVIGIVGYAFSKTKYDVKGWIKEVYLWLIS